MAQPDAQQHAAHPDVAHADPVLVVDFGAQYAQLIARRVRECHVYSEIVPYTATIDELLARKPKAIILSGGPKSVYSPGAPAVDPALFAAGVPVLGICYGHQVMAQALGGRVEPTGIAEYGATRLAVARSGVLFAELPADQQVWMSHGDTVVEAPDGFTVTASTASTPVAAFEEPGRGLYGVQFHPEVVHTEEGLTVLSHFLRAAGCRPTWTMVNIVDEAVANIREQVGTDGRAICGLSGGVDSAVAAAVVHRAIGDRLTCVFVDHGLLRKGEAEQVENDFVASTGVDLVHVKCADRFASALAGVTDPEQKRKIIGREFIRVFEEAARDIKSSRQHEVDADYLVQGTLYPDVIESGSPTAAKIKSHHNVGGLPEDLQFELVEPLRTLFKDEVRRVGEELGPAQRDRLAPAVPRSGPRGAHHRRDHARAARPAARGRRDRPRRDHPRRARPGDLAGVRRAAGRRAVGRGHGRRAHLRPSGDPAGRHERRRDDRRLGAAAVSRAGAHQQPRRQRGARDQPGRLRHHLEAAGHHRVGVTRTR